MENNQSEDVKTEDKTVAIEIDEENYRRDNSDIKKISNDDYLITIKQTKFLKIKYFNFGKNIHFYLFCGPKKTNYKLSEIPTPSFTLGPECKNFLCNI